MCFSSSSSFLLLLFLVDNKPNDKIQHWVASVGRVLILTNEHFARLWPTWWGLLYNLQIRTKQQLSQTQSRSRSWTRATLNYGFHSFGSASLVRFVWRWPQTNQLTAINLTSVANMEGLSRVSLDYLTFNFWLHGGIGERGREGTPLAKCSARAVSKLLSQITRISDATRSTGFSVLLKLRCQMLECFYFSISTSTSTFISTLSLLLFSFYMYFYFEWISVAIKHLVAAPASQTTLLNHINSSA